MKQAKLENIKKFIKDALSRTFTSASYRCLACDAAIFDRHEYICGECKEKLSVKDITKCEVCNRLVKSGTCRYCIEHDKPYEKIYTVFEYAEPINKYINEFKEQGKTIYGKMLVKTMLDIYDDMGIENIDLIASVPANAYRKILRLRDAPRYFARALSRYTGIEYTNKSLMRKGLAHAMRKKSPKQRMDAANKSYANGTYNVEGKNILLVDDVFTTGATTHVCTNLLLTRGAKSVHILAMVCVKNT